LVLKRKSPRLDVDRVYLNFLDFTIYIQNDFGFKAKKPQA